MKEDDWIALEVTLFVLIMVGLICLLGLGGYFTSWT